MEFYRELDEEEERCDETVFGKQMKQNGELKRETESDSSESEYKNKSS